MTSRSWGRLIARAASSARSMSCWPTSRCLPDTAITPRLLTPRMCPPAMPTRTEAISTPAISSASLTACLMDSTVESMLTTTPLRRPRQGLKPDTDDVEVAHAPTTRRSRSTTSSSPRPARQSPGAPWPWASTPSLHRGLQHDLIAESQVDGGHGLAGGLELGEHAEEARRGAPPSLPCRSAPPRRRACRAPAPRPGSCRSPRRCSASPRPSARAAAAG